MNVWAKLILIGLILPLITCFFPIRKGSRTSVRKALDHLYQEFQGNRIRLPQKWSIPIWMKLSLSYGIQNLGRTILSLLILMAGIILLLSALNLRSSLELSLDNNNTQQQFDIEIALGRSYPIDSLTPFIKQIPAIQKAHYLYSGSLYIDANRKAGGTRIRTVSMPMQAFPSQASLIAGQIPSSGSRKLLLNQGVLKQLDHIHIGDTLWLSYAKTNPTPWVISGLIREIGFPGQAYMPLSSWEANFQTNLYSNTIRISANSPLAIPPILQAIESESRSMGIQIRNVIDKAERNQIVRDHLSIMIYFLLAMAGLVLVVGGLGISSYVTLSLMERKRPLGIMKAIGASKAKIWYMMLAEILLLISASWILGSILSVPVSQLMVEYFGNLILQVKLDFDTSLMGMFLSFILMLLLVMVFSVIPIRKGIRVPAHHALVQA